MRECTNTAPADFTGHWRDWHRGHGCEKDPETEGAHEALNTGRGKLVALPGLGQKSELAQLAGIHLAVLPPEYVEKMLAQIANEARSGNCAGVVVGIIYQSGHMGRSFFGSLPLATINFLVDQMKRDVFTLNDLNRPGPLPPAKPPGGGGG